MTQIAALAFSVQTLIRRVFFNFFIRSWNSECGWKKSSSFLIYVYICWLSMPSVIWLSDLCVIYLLTCNETTAWRVWIGLFMWQYWSAFVGVDRLPHFYTSCCITELNYILRTFLIICCPVAPPFHVISAGLRVDRGLFGPCVEVYGGLGLYWWQSMGCSDGSSPWPVPALTPRRFAQALASCCLYKRPIGSSKRQGMRFTDIIVTNWCKRCININEHNRSVNNSFMSTLLIIRNSGVPLLLVNTDTPTQ
jgi:hypothetical protein